MNDISLFTSSGNAALQFSLQKATVATGLLKLSQRLVLRLLTELGTASGRPNFGSNLIRDIRLGRYPTTGAIEQGFAEDRLNLLLQSREDVSSDPYDTLVDIRLIGVRKIADLVVLQLRVVSQAGESAVFPLVV
jgi:hypothetical protein